MGNRGVCNHLLLVGFFFVFVFNFQNACHPLSFLFLKCLASSSFAVLEMGTQGKSGFLLLWHIYMNILTKLYRSSHNLGAALSTLTGGHVVFVLQGTEAVENEKIPVMMLLAEDVFTQERIKQSCVWFCKHGFYSWLINRNS